jgi:hypothetical protein
MTNVRINPRASSSSRLSSALQHVSPRAWSIYGAEGAQPVATLANASGAQRGRALNGVLNARLRVTNM